MFKRKVRYYAASFWKHDFKASVNVFFEALPLCVGVALASNVPLSAGFIAGIVGGWIILLFSRSSAIINGPSAGMITVSAAAVTTLGSIELFFSAVFLAGFLQLLMGALSLGRFTYFIPSVVIKGMLAALGLLLIIKQFPYTLGYNHLEFMEGEYLKILAIGESIQEIADYENHFSWGVLIISLVSAGILWFWEEKLSKKITYLPTYLIVVVIGVLMALYYREFVPALALQPSHYVSIPRDVMADFTLHNVIVSFGHVGVWRSALIICMVASIQSLATIDAIDKIDTYHRITPRNNALAAQGTANMLCGILGGLPVTTLIARSTTNVESGARTMLSSVCVGLWLLATVFFISYLINHIPYCVLAAILIKIGIRLVNPTLILRMYRSGKNQFYPFLVTVIAILFTGVVTGILAGIIYSFYCMIKSNYKDEFILHIKTEGHLKHYYLWLAHHVNFLNKKSIIEVLDRIPDYSIVEVIGSNDGIVDFDIIEIFIQFKAKARSRHIEFITRDVPGLTAVNLAKQHFP